MSSLTQAIAFETSYRVVLGACGEDKVVEITGIVPYAELNWILPVKYYMP